MEGSFLLTLADGLQSSSLRLAWEGPFRIWSKIVREGVPTKPAQSMIFWQIQKLSAQDQLIRFGPKSVNFRKCILKTQIGVRICLIITNSIPIPGATFYFFASYLWAKFALGPMKDRGRSGLQTLDGEEVVGSPGYTQNDRIPSKILNTL